jgi:Mg/Co/Ni transporter MgtE
VTAGPEEDVPETVTRMADFNLLVLPIVDSDSKLLGAITVDDALEAAILGNWRQRGPGHSSSRQRNDDEP